MKLTRRVEDGRQVRVLEWDENNSTDLGALVAMGVVTVVCAGAVTGAVETTSWLRAVLLVVAVLSGVVWLVMAGTFLVIAVVVTAVRARRITAAAEALMALAGAGVGAAVGLETYEAGPGALVLGPAVAALVAVAVRPRLRTRAARVRLTALAVLGAVAAVAVGATIFL